MRQNAIILSQKVKEQTFCIQDYVQRVLTTSAVLPASPRGGALETQRIAEAVRVRGLRSAQAQCAARPGPAVVERSARHGAVPCAFALYLAIVCGSVRRVDLILPAGAQQKVFAGGDP